MCIEFSTIALLLILIMINTWSIIANPKYFVFIYFNLSNNFFSPYVTLLHRRRKKFKPSTSVVFHRDDGQTEVETVDLTEALQQDQEELQNYGDDEFMPELED